MGRKHAMPRILELLVGIGTPFVYIFMLLVQGKRPFYLAYHFGFGKGAAEWLRTHPGAEHIISMCVGLLCGLVIANQINNGPTMLSKEVDSETRKAIAEAEEKQKMVLDKLSDATKREAAIEKKWEAKFEEEKKGRIEIREKYINLRKMSTEQQLQLRECEEEIADMSNALTKTNKRERSEGETKFIKESLEALSRATDFKSMDTLDNLIQGDKTQLTEAEETYSAKMKLFKARKAAGNIRGAEKRTTWNGVNGGAGGTP